MSQATLGGVPACTGVFLPPRLRTGCVTEAASPDTVCPTFSEAFSFDSYVSFSLVSGSVTETLYIKGLPWEAMTGGLTGRWLETVRLSSCCFVLWRRHGSVSHCRQELRSGNQGGASEWRTRVRSCWHRGPGCPETHHTAGVRWEPPGCELLLSGRWSHR